MQEEYSDKIRLFAEILLTDIFHCTAGGHNGSREQDNIYQFDPDHYDWRVVGHLAVRRDYFAVSTIDNSDDLCQD